MQRLIIDIGNTLVKLAVFNNDRADTMEYLPSIDTESLQNLLAKYPEIKSSIISSVRNYPDELD